MTDAECRELAGLLGIEPEIYDYEDYTGHVWQGERWPNFLDPCVVLKEMRKREDWKEFIYTGLHGLECHANQSIHLAVIDIMVSLINHYILDETGLLAKAALEWLRKESKHEQRTGECRAAG